jgi:hypothetical protein
MNDSKMKLICAANSVNLPRKHHPYPSINKTCQAFATSPSSKSLAA